MADSNNGNPTLPAGGISAPKNEEQGAVGTPSHDDDTLPIDGISRPGDGERSEEAYAQTIAAVSGPGGGPGSGAARGGASLVDERLTDLHPGRYEVEQEIGAGGIGKVYLALDTHLGRQVALKELLTTLPGSVDGASGRVSGSRTPIELRFVNEARITGQLEHPGVVPVYELGRRPDDTVYYAMQLVRGRTLEEALSERDLRGRLKLLPHFVDLCNTVAYAHSRKVIHRDLKPENVMLGDYGETVLLDWGLAKAQGTDDVQERALEDEIERLKDASPLATVAGVPIGTPGYMPPEQALGNLDEVDERSDVYSLGAILYQLLTGRAPFEGQTALEVITAVVRGQSTPVDELEPHCPAELTAIATRAMQADRSERYADAQALAADVGAFLTGGIVGAHRYSWTARLWRELLRYKWILAAGVAVIAVGGVAWWYRGVDLARQQAQEQERRRVEAVAQVDQVIVQVAEGTGKERWFDTFTFKLLALGGPGVEAVVEDRVIQALAHPSTDVRRLAARTLSGMGSVRAVDSLVARLAEGVEEEVVVTIEVMNALGVIGDARAEPAVRDARWRHGQASAVWIQTDLAYQMIPLAPLPADRSTMTAEDWHSRGRALLWKSEHDDAIDAYTQAIELDPKSTKSYNNRAIVWRQLGQNDKALADYDKVLLLEPGSPRTLNNRAILKRSLEDYDGALADLDQVVAGGKVGPLALRNRALTKRLMGDIEGARADLQLALDSNPKDARSYAQVGSTWAWTHDWDRALSAYEQAIAISDKYTFPVLARARILYILGRQQEASDAVDHVLRLDPHDNRARRVRAHLHMLAGRHDAAKRDLDFCLENECIRGYTRNALRYAQRAIVYHAALGDYDSALRDLQSALDSHPRREDSVAYRLEALAVSLRAGDLSAQDHWLEALAPSDRGLWHDRLMQMVHGRESYAAVVEAMDGSSQRRCLMALAGGVAAELAGDGSRAVDRYRTAAQAYEPHHLACILAGQAERFLVAD
jgi:tetratricopeptide (TPR) repeat protein